MLVTWQACKQQTSTSQVRWRQRVRFFCRCQARHVDVRLLPRRCALRTDVIRGPRFWWVGHPLSPSHCKSDGTAQSADILVACRVHSRSSGSCVVLGVAARGTPTTGAAIQQVAAGGLQRAQVACSWDMHRQVAALPTGAAAACPGLWCSGLALGQPPLWRCVAWCATKDSTGDRNDLGNGTPAPELVRKGILRGHRWPRALNPWDPSGFASPDLRAVLRVSCRNGFADVQWPASGVPPPGRFCLC